jgi:glucosyl-dolichyl phosphate glucuronosyltransferase
VNLSPCIRPTVCTNRPTTVIGPCLSALDKSGLSGATLVVLSGLAESVRDERCREIKRLVPGATVLVEPEEGLSRARNLALSAVAPTDVVAYLDDDAVIADTWPSAMARAWSEAAQDVAAVGGPINPMFLAPRPAWLSDYLLGGLSIIDHGSEPRMLVGTNGFLYGANLSVVARHALAAGGFDLRRGPLGHGPGFGDDIDIQVRLHRLGLRVLYEPEAAVFHRIPPERLRRRTLLRRRYAQGREQARATVGPQFMSATRGLIAGLARAAAYTCVRKPDFAMNHLSYGLQSVGVLREVLHDHATRGPDARLPIQKPISLAGRPGQTDHDNGSTRKGIDDTGS